MQKAKANKVYEPTENKDETPMVWIKINQCRVIAGLGAAGDEVQVSQLVAMNFVAQGLATIIDPTPSVLRTSPPIAPQLGEKDI